MSTDSSLFASLSALSDEELSDILARSPELIRRAQKALSDAKRKAAISAAASMSEASGPGLARSFDLKSWQKAKRLITGPHNAANAQELEELFKLTHPAATPPGERSLLLESLEYLAGKTQVLLEWPLAVFRAGGEFDEPETSAFLDLFIKRGPSELGPNAQPFFVAFFNQSAPWASREPLLDQALLKCQNPRFVKDCQAGFVAFFKKIAFDQCHSLDAKGPNRWTALGNLVSAGCRPCPREAQAGIFAGMPWESLISVPAPGEALDDKIDAFLAMVKRGWLDHGTAAPSDNLQRPPSLPAGESAFANCGSRSIVRHCSPDGSMARIFAAMCDREESVGFSRYDALGRSRLYFINERARCAHNGDNQSDLVSMARLAMELGDSPESVNAQNPLAKASTSDIRDALAVEIERRDLGSATPSAAPRRRASAL